jgi:hypothetical protein
MRVELLLFFMGIQNIRLLNVCTATKKIPYFFLFVEINPKSPCTVNGLRKQVGVVFLYFDVLFREPLSGAKKKNQNQTETFSPEGRGAGGGGGGDYLEHALKEGSH